MQANPALWRPSDGPAQWPFVAIGVGVVITLAFIYLW